jgi:hypothetical protein
MNRLATLVLLVGCTRDTAPVPAVTQAPATTAAASNALAGRVVETMDAGSYTYALLERNGGSKVWVAGPKTRLAVGTVLGEMTGQAMPNFHSKTLNRTFEEIYFVQAIAVAPASTATAAAPTAAPAADDATALGGTVVETMDSGGYTYAMLERDGKKVWVAGPQTKLAVGAKLAGLTGTLMAGFRSDTLARTFDQIYFVGGFGAATTAAADPHGTAPAAAPAEPIEPVAPAPGGKTVAAIFTERAALNGKPVVVRGKITKLTTGVLGKNWIHLRDGSGAAGSNDLIVTTLAEPKLGDIVVVRGSVAIDKDFGAGYAYPVLIENATLAAN